MPYLKLLLTATNNNKELVSVGKPILIPYETEEYATFIVSDLSIFIYSTMSLDHINFNSYFQFKGDIIKIVNGNANFNEIDGAIGNTLITIGSQLYTILSNSPKYKDYIFTLNVDVPGGLLTIICRPKGDGSIYDPSPEGLSPDVIDATTNITGFNDICLGQLEDFSAILICEKNLGYNGELQNTQIKKYSIPYQGFNNYYINKQNPYIFDVSDFASTDLKIKPSFSLGNKTHAFTTLNFTLFVSYRYQGQIREFYDPNQVHNLPIIKRAHLSKIENDINNYIFSNIGPVKILTDRGKINDYIIEYETCYDTVREVNFLQKETYKIKLELIVELNDGSTYTRIKTFSIFNYGQIYFNIQYILNEFGVNIDRLKVKSLTYTVYDEYTNNEMTKLKELINQNYNNDFKNNFTIQFLNSHGGFDSYSGHDVYTLETTGKSDTFKKNITFGRKNNTISIVDNNELGIYNIEAYVKYKITLDPLPDYELEYIVKELLTTKELYLHLNNVGNLDNKVFLETNSLSYTTNDLGQQLSFVVRSSRNLKTINNING